MEILYELLISCIHPSHPKSLHLRHVYFKGTRIFTGIDSIWQYRFTPPVNVNPCLESTISLWWQPAGEGLFQLPHSFPMPRLPLVPADSNNKKSTAIAFANLTLIELSCVKPFQRNGDFCDLWRVERLGEEISHRHR